MPSVRPIEIKPQRFMARPAALVGVLVAGGAVGLGLRVALGDGGGVGDVASTLAYLLFVAAPGAVVLALMLRSQRRRRLQLLDQAGPDVVFASTGMEAEVQSVDHPRRFTRLAHWSSGVLTVGKSGVSFTHVKPGQTFPETRLAWSQIEALECERENPVRAFVRVRTTTRQIHSWRVVGARELEAALRILQQD